MTDVCGSADDVPEVMFSARSTGRSGHSAGHPVHRQGRERREGVTGSPGSGTWTSRQHCHQETPWQGQDKALGLYTLPWWDIRVSGTWQSIRCAQIAAFATYSETANGVTTFSRSTLTTLGRPLTNSASTLNLIEPGTQWGDRLNQIDLRFRKIVGLPKGRIDLNFDLYNAFNSDRYHYSAEQRRSRGRPFGYGYPLQAIPPRFAKLECEVGLVERRHRSVCAAFTNSGPV